MPAGMPGSHQTRPRQSSALPQHPPPAAHGSPSGTPSIGTPHPCGTSLADGFTVHPGVLLANFDSPALARW